MEEKTLYKDDIVREVESFLKAKFPAEIRIREDIDTVFFTAEDTQSIIAEDSRQKFLLQAILDQTNNRLFSSYRVTDFDCDGHVVNKKTKENFPFLPMGKLGQIMAQSGELLILTEHTNLVSDNGADDPDDILALVKSVQSIESSIVRLSGAAKFFLLPGYDIFMISSYKSERLTTSSCTIEVFIQGKIMTKMSLTYEVLNWDRFVKIYHMQLKGDEKK